MNELLSVVVPNWNGKHHLSTCLDSLRRQTLPADEIIVVDDGSSDGSVEFLHSSYPWVKTVLHQENRGLTATVNTGLAAAQGALVALLNNDTEVHPEWLERMVRALEAHPSAGSVACRMIRFDDRAVLDGAGDFMSKAASPYTRGFGEPDDGRYSAAEFIFGACAGAALYRRSVFETVGGLDEDFIFYYDDVDLSFRAQLAGFRCVYEPSAICYHKRGATIGTKAPRFQERNLTAVQLKNIPGPLLVALFPLLLFSRARRLYRQIRQGYGRPALAGFVQGLVIIPAMYAKRRTVQRLRRVPLRYILSLFGRNV